ncbi:fluoride efflux transporter CrcB [Haloarchaeobius sp. TZWWS8]|uniref:fluoride efflux transporter CrcB n=1 Tax=Haloarchaeobius sp. TZWWS8 TaxID=3446121 RepID=UPI003EBB8132
MSTIAPAYLVGLGGALGALLRHWVYSHLKRAGDPVPRATLTVNVVGSLVLGFLTAAAPGQDLALFVGTGACGAFTTFSSFSFETVDRWTDGKRLAAVANALGNLVLSLAAVAAGWTLAGFV